MSEQTVKKEIVEPLLTWYNAVKRNLPWRDKDNAYYTWVSEIMLQQTRVEAVKPYFKRALKKSDSKKELGFFSYFHYNRNIRRERLPC